MEKVTFDYSKLKGRITEKLGSQKEYAKQLGISETSMVSKLSGSTYFTQGEIEKSMLILELEPGSVTRYFFTPKV